jgi:hypothetical protein
VFAQRTAFLEPTTDGQDPPLQGGRRTLSASGSPRSVLPVHAVETPAGGPLDPVANRTRGDAELGCDFAKRLGSATLQALTAGQTAEDTFTYTIRDSQGGTDTATVHVTVTGLAESSGSQGSGSLSAASFESGVVVPRARLETGADTEATNDSITTRARDALELEPSPGIVGYSDVLRMPSVFQGLSINRLLAAGGLLDLEDAIRDPADSAARWTGNGSDHVARLMYAQESGWSTPPGGERGHNGGQRAGVADQLLTRTPRTDFLPPGCRAALDRILEEESGGLGSFSRERGWLDLSDEADAESWWSEDDGENDHCAKDAADTVPEAFRP